MVSVKELRDVFKDIRFKDIRSEAGKRAIEAMSDARMPSIGRRDDPPIGLIFAVGLALGAAIGLLAAFLSAPYTGDETRRRLSVRVEKMRHQGEERLGGAHAGNGSTAYKTSSAVAEKV